MAVVIRLRRGGKKKMPIYRIVATDSKFPRDGRFLEIVGQYNPLPEKETINIEHERVVYWLSRGAQPSDTVRSLLAKHGLWEGLIKDKISTHVNNEVKVNAETDSAPVGKDKE